MSNSKLKILKFYTQKCGPCAQIKPMIDEVSKETGVEIISIDALSEESSTARYKVRAVPTLIFIKNDVEVERKTGLISKTDLVALIEKHNS